MVKHIVAWQLKEEIPANERDTVKSTIKTKLEALVGIVPGLLSAQVITEPIDSSTHDVILICELESNEALKGYQTNEHHVAAATYVRAHVCNRTCLDYEM